MLKFKNKRTLPLATRFPWRRPWALSDFLFKVPDIVTDTDDDDEIPIEILLILVRNRNDADLELVEKSIRENLKKDFVMVINGKRVHLKQSLHNNCRFVTSESDNSICYNHVQYVHALSNVDMFNMTNPAYKCILAGGKDMMWMERTFVFTGFHLCDQVEMSSEEFEIFLGGYFVKHTKFNIVYKPGEFSVSTTGLDYGNEKIRTCVSDTPYQLKIVPSGSRTPSLALSALTFGFIYPLCHASIP